MPANFPFIDNCGCQHICRQLRVDFAQERRLLEIAQFSRIFFGTAERVGGGQIATGLEVRQFSGCPLLPTLQRATLTHALQR